MKILVCLGRTKHGEWDKKYPNNLRNDPVIQAWQRYQMLHSEHEIIGYDNVSENPQGDFDAIIQYENHKHIYNPHIFSSLHHYKKAYRVFYVQDTVRYPEIHQRMSKHFDLIFCSQRNAFQSIEHPNKVFYPMGIDPYKIFKINKFPKMYDIGLVSGMKDFEYRNSYLKYVEDIAKGVFWNGINPNDLGYFYNLCKIGLNLSTRGTWDMIAYRTLEVMGSGSFLITNRLNKGILEELYEENVHYVAFDDKNYDEFREKVQYYLNHNEEREQIAAAGYKLVHEKYTWGRQVEEIIKSILINKGV
jgi:hypothetical protein